jgi:hypothetical protein
VKNSELFVLASSLEDKRSLLMSGNEIDKISLLFSDDLYYGHASGLTDSKSSYLTKLENKVFRYKSVQVNLSSVTALGENAFLACGIEQSRLIAGAKKSRSGSSTWGYGEKKPGDGNFSHTKRPLLKSKYQSLMPAPGWRESPLPFFF